MKLLISLIVILLFSCTSQSSKEFIQTDLNGAKGKIFKVNTSLQSFELLKETVYDPKTNEGKSRFKIYWDEKTRFNIVKEQQDFKGIKGPVWADFNPVNERHANSMTSGKSFHAKTVTFRSGLEKRAGLSDDKRHFIALFTPNPSDKRTGTVKINNKDVKVSLRTVNQKVIIHQKATSSALANGFWKTTVKGQWINDKFICQQLILTELPDPRESDDPKLPRVLVVGDSISMNYHNAAKAALEGVANYHRIDGNGGPSDRGANNVELWLGDYTQKGFHWDVIQFNHGLHDLKQVYDQEYDTWGAHQVNLKDYKNNLRKEIELLKKTGAKLIWCETTPVPNSSKGKYARRKGEAAVFNKAALEVIREYPEIQINKLHDQISNSPIFDKWRQQSDVHFYGKDLQVFLGKAVAEAVVEALRK